MCSTTTLLLYGGSIPSTVTRLVCFLLQSCCNLLSSLRSCSVLFLCLFLLSRQLLLLLLLLPSCHLPPILIFKSLQPIQRFIHLGDTLWAAVLIANTFVGDLTDWTGGTPSRDTEPSRPPLRATLGFQELLTRLPLRHLMLTLIPRVDRTETHLDSVWPCCSVLVFCVMWLLLYRFGKEDQKMVQY